MKLNNTPSFRNPTLYIGLPNINMSLLTVHNTGAVDYGNQSPMGYRENPLKGIVSEKLTRFENLY